MTIDFVLHTQTDTDENLTLFWRCGMYAKPLKTAQIGDFRQVNFVLPADLYIRLKTRCAENRESLKSALTQAILTFLSEEN